MFEEILMPLLLVESLGRLKGKTRFQKLVYIIQNEASNRNVAATSFDYEIHYYGPFSSELTKIIEGLEVDHLLDEEVEMTPSGYTRYVYSVTDKGRKLLDDARNKRLIAKELEKIVKKIADDYGITDLSQLVQEAYRRYNE